VTTPNPAVSNDKELFQILSIKPREAFKEKKQQVEVNFIPSVAEAMEEVLN
jgi:biotin synthase